MFVVSCPREFLGIQVPTEFGRICGCADVFDLFYFPGVTELLVKVGATPRACLNLLNLECLEIVRFQETSTTLAKCQNPRGS